MSGATDTVWRRLVVGGVRLVKAVEDGGEASEGFGHSV